MKRERKHVFILILSLLIASFFFYKAYEVSRINNQVILTSNTNVQEINSKALSTDTVAPLLQPTQPPLDPPISQAVNEVSSNGEQFTSHWASTAIGTYLRNTPQYIADNRMMELPINTTVWVDDYLETGDYNWYRIKVDDKYGYVLSSSIDFISDYEASNNAQTSTQPVLISSTASPSIGKSNYTSTYTAFTNQYGTSTTKCAHAGCNNYIASSGDTNCCTIHSRKCLNCGKYIDEDALYCISCKALTSNSSSTKSNSGYSSAKQNTTMGEKNALAQAKKYLNYTAFSRSGLIEQLKYEGYSQSEATYAVNNCGADWNEQAARKAKQYLAYKPFSRSGHIEQLEYEGFTHSQAIYGVSQNGY